ncbi:DNA polymerase III subunit gamma/tau [Yersinia enterocolitica]|uniref:DNA polymerase III subunit gamma/tau n=1 Tax=Yersinia enterocolitica serotype O:8 / biotype 1B (strain NCTC 13174 / 8081) TaxID=393305 RepID=A1JNC0_YERE8|nr:DNA polymerase III subunit gamma/tau [Yersinia enterocolitica]AJJ23066.1 DNA polymerase III, subunit gamma and tau [Yersinia enterocolitica]CAL13128.1 DNA polymerase III subunit Tau (contains DNA polymerase III subunit Gamma) [Yersinia enterocolitica subsp. enterocolitica 8081]CNF87437.1 DNA polymerase III subunits gamma and tau [Yersinia enterocolitica]CRY05528.1 DNA polymerase III subunits gamma and tau [Yersinia enterocolitica]CRY09163.1 DNA polymerase III subunits gamma and tau [Yersini
MSYQVLARKWRPKTFADVVGQEHVLTALANGLSLGRIHHAYLFSGTRGVGKTSIARLLAKGLNCETGITATPCGTCANCLEIEQGRFVDLIEIDAASRTKVEDTRELLDNVQYAPARGRFKVYLIDEVHMLSRHSFNALLKTLEEPPAHVKFLLATTDPQKLPVTILSRCLQFHLKVIDVEVIRAQLEKILLAEQISSDARALQLLARAADGSMRDALSLADQAIAMGDGHVTTATVSQMLGILDDEQPLAIIEALVSADGARVMAQLEQAASRGVDWENLLVETLSLLHRIAMVQLLPSMLDNHYATIEPRLRELARTLPPTDIQLYYQTLLVGRKELAYAPDRRMGVEMTLLRALAFHPKAIIAEPQKVPVSAPAAITDNTPAPQQHFQAPSSTQPAPQHEAPPLGATAPVNTELPDATAQLLQARTQLLRKSGTTPPKKNEPAAPGKARPVNSALERLASVTERSQQRLAAKSTEEKKPAKKEAYRWTAQNQPEVPAEPVATPKALRSALEHEKTPELSAKLAQEAMVRDPWAAEIDKLHIPKLVQQLALNAFKEEIEPGNIRLHLRSAQRHLNSPSAQQTLADALSELHGNTVTLSVIEDDNLAERTPLEWRQAIYEEKLAQARQSIIADNNIQTLRRFFDAELDEESIRPV